MDLKDFNSGKQINQLEYKSFSPEKINHEWIISTPEANKLLAEANRLPKLGSKFENAQQLLKQLYQVPITDYKQVAKFPGKSNTL